MNTKSNGTSMEEAQPDDTTERAADARKYAVIVEKWVLYKLSYIVRTVAHIVLLLLLRDYVRGVPSAHAARR